MKKSTICKGLLVLALALAVAVPVCAWSGSGTSSNPYLISDYQDLLKVKDYPGAYFKQTADITVNDPSLFEFNDDGVIINAKQGAKAWTPVENFTGTYDGYNKYITGLYVTEDNANGGLFATINGGTVNNLNFEYALVESDEYAGILAGKIDGEATVENCMTSGSVIGKTTKSMNTVGGLAGFVGKDATISNSVSYATVTGANSYSANVGGLVGLNHGTITACGFGGDVYGVATYYDAAVGGIAGYNTGDIDNCRVADGKIGGESTAKVNDCYVGGVAGINKGSVASCVNESGVSVKNFSSGDSICAAGGIVGTAIDAVVTENTNNGAITGESSYLGGIAGVAISDTGANYVDYNDNTGSVTSLYGVAGGIVGRAVAAGEGYVSIKLYVDSCYNSGALSGNKTGNTAGETAKVESASVIIYEGDEMNNNICSARTIYKIVAEKVQYGKIVSSFTAVSGTGSTASRVATAKFEQHSSIRLNGRNSSTGAFVSEPVLVTLVTVADASKVEIYNADVSGLTLSDGKLSGNIVVKVYKPNLTTEAEVVVGLSVGGKYVTTAFATVDKEDRLGEVTIPVNATVDTTGTITVNVLVVDDENNMSPLCENAKVTK